MIGRTTQEFVDQEVLPQLDRLEQKDWALARQLVQRCGELGLLGVDVAETYGGLDLDKVTSMDPEQEVPLVFACWEKWLQEAGIGVSIADVDFLEIHAFGAQPKAPNPLADPLELPVDEQEGVAPDDTPETRPDVGPQGDVDHPRLVLEG